MMSPLKHLDPAQAGYFFGVRHMKITAAVLKAAMPRVTDAEAWAAAFDEAVKKWPVDDVAMFLAQVGHESSDLTRTEESLYYSTPSHLARVFSSRLWHPKKPGEKCPPGKKPASNYLRSSKILANYVYSGRLGNGDEESGDGWNFRGSGPMQLTGRDNFAAFEAASGFPVLAYPDLVRDDKRVGAASACFFWCRNISAKSIEGVTRQVNGPALAGLDDRRRRYEAAQRALT